VVSLERERELAPHAFKFHVRNKMSDEMPPLGFGTARLGSGPTLERALRAAVVDAGTLHVDCAKLYGNEEAVGRVLRALTDEGRVTRERLWVTSKLWNDDHADVRGACVRSLRRLQLDYLDLYLIHWPLAWRRGTVLCPDDSVTLADTWRAMEALVEEGLVRRVGVSNFDRSVLARDILPHCRITPYANQIELHPFNAQPELVRFCQERGIRVVAWSPLAKGAPALAGDATLVRIARARGATVTQVVLRWHAQRGVVPIPRSSSPAHVVENAAALKLELELTDAEMRDIGALNKNERLFFDVVGVFDDTAPVWGYVGAALRGLARLVFAVAPNRVDLMQPQRTD